MTCYGLMALVVKEFRKVLLSSSVKDGDFCYNARMTSFSLNPQLEADTHQLLSCDDFYVLLHKNKTLPWFIVVPKNTVTEWYELPELLQQELAGLTRKLSLYLKQNHQCDKINTASIGNVVSQLHVHVIGRFKEDPLWPDVAWGNALPDSSYSHQELADWAKQLRAALKVL